MKKSELQSLINQAEGILEDHLRAAPNDHRLQYVREHLTRIRERIQTQWPIREPSIVTGNIGLYAVRELEGYHDDLAEVLERIDYGIEHPEA